MPKSKNKPESVKHAAVSERLHEASRAQWRHDYAALVPASLNRIKNAIEGGPVDKVVLFAAFQVLKGTGVHEERARSKNDVKISQDFTDLSGDELKRSIEGLLPPQPAAKA